MNKIFQVIVCCFIALAMVSCSQEEVKPKNVFSMNLKSATIKPIGLGGDSLTYQSSCNIALMVNSDKHLQLIISDLVLGGKLGSIPITLQLESDDLVVTQSNITTLHFTGKTVKSNLFVLSGIDGNIDLVQKHSPCRSCSMASKPCSCLPRSSRQPFCNFLPPSRGKYWVHYLKNNNSSLFSIKKA